MKKPMRKTAKKPVKKSTNKKPSKSQKARSRLLLADDLPADSGATDQRSSALREIAGKLASRLGAVIDLVHVEDNTFYPLRDPEYRLMFERYERERDARMQASVGTSATPIRTVLLKGSPAAAIVAQAGKRSEGYELVIVGTQARKGLSRLFTGSVAEEIIRRSRVPVMTVAPQAQEMHGKFLAEEKLRILVPTSLSKNSEKAEAYAAKLARKLGAELVLVYSLYDGMHPVIQSVFAMPTPSAQIGGMLNDLKNNALKELGKKAQALRRNGVPVTVILDHDYNTADAAILRESLSTGASLIVMGTHGRSVLSEAFFGRTARGVILGAQIPVITVQSKRA